MIDGRRQRTDIFHALGLHMHQPPENLGLLIETNEFEARQIILCYERPLKYAEIYKDVARFHVGFSGVLLEQFQDPYIIDRYRDIVDIPQMLGRYRKATNIELIGMGYYHPIFPLIPIEDWDDQLRMGREKVSECFGRPPKGFWPPEMAFTMELIPALVKAGYEYVVVDSVHVRPEGEAVSDLRNIIYRPSLAEYNGDQIVIIPRDRDISNAQESGFDPVWFKNEVEHKTTSIAPPCMVTTWSDGENGGWFRQMDEASGFWGHYFSPYMDGVKKASITIKPTLISEFIQEFSPTDRVHVKTGAWNVGSTSGYDFAQWAGSEKQRGAMEAVWGISKEYHELTGRLNSLQSGPTKDRGAAFLKKARKWLLRSETSCFFFWGDAWIDKVYENVEPAREFLVEARKVIG